MVRVDRTGVWPLDRRAMRVELVVPNMVREFLPFRMEIERYPTNVMFSGIGVSDLFAHSNFDLKHLVRIYFVRTLDNRNMFLCFPIGFLHKFSNLGQSTSSPFLLSALLYRPNLYNLNFSRKQNTRFLSSHFNPYLARVLDIDTQGTCTGRKFNNQILLIGYEQL
jgi:hypothetical protein